MGRFFESFFEFFGLLCRCVCGSRKCGLDLLFVMNQAHWHLPAQAEKVIKYVNFGGRFLAALWDSISEPFWRHFWRHFGTILGSKWRKTAVQKAMEKKGRKKSCGCPRVSAGVGAAVPLKHYNIGAPGGHITLYNHSTGALGARWRILGTLGSASPR